MPIDKTTTNALAAAQLCDLHFPRGLGGKQIEVQDGNVIWYANGTKPPSGC
jgi:hypothetical protein